MKQKIVIGSFRYGAGPEQKSGGTLRTETKENGVDIFRLVDV